MRPGELAHAVKEELAASLADQPGARPPAAVESVEPPAAVGPDDVFRVTLRAPDGAELRVELPANLAVGYLADEEAAVDEWRRWVRALAQRLAG